MTEFTADDLEGIAPAVPTPRYESDNPVNPGNVNYDALEDHLEYIAERGVHGVTLAGCTGLASEFSHDDHVEFVSRAADMARERDLYVIAGTATNSTRESYELGRDVEENADIDAHLLIYPYKVKPELEGVETHYEALADELEAPGIVYNVPSRTGRGFNPDEMYDSIDTLVRLADHDNIIGFKDATGEYEFSWRLDRELTRNGVEDFGIMSGDDPNSHYIYELDHGTGTISVSGNVAPEEVVEVWEQGYVEGNHQETYEMNEDLEELHSSMFIESNPGPVHEALSMMGFDYQAVPAPLNQVSDENREQLRDTLDEYGLLDEVAVQEGEMA